MKKKLSLLVSLTLLTFTNTHTKEVPYKAVVIVPVANVFNDYLSNKFPNATESEIRNLYLNVLSSNKENGQFMRISQLLLHEVVTVTEERGCECIVKCSDRFFHNDKKNKVYYSFVALKSELMPLDDLGLENPYSVIPAPYEWYNKESYAPTKTIFTLTTSYVEPTTNINLSGGTRFIITRKDATSVEVFMLHDGHYKTITIPLSNGEINIPRTKEEKRDCILTGYEKACNTASPLATAFGGNSTAYYPPQAFVETTLNLPNGQQVKGFNRPQDPHQPERGCTIMELYNKIANACGVPAFLNNTTTFYREAPRLQEGQQIEEGGFIAAPSYMGCIYSVERNLVADIRSYSNHSGCAQCVPLHKNFKGITTYEELMNAWKTGKPLTLLDRNGKDLITYNAGDWHIKPFIHEYNQEFWAEYAQLYK